MSKVIRLNDQTIEWLQRAYTREEQIAKDFETCNMIYPKAKDDNDLISLAITYYLQATENFNK